MAGASALSTRLLYQAMSAVVLVAGGWFIWRRTRSAAAVAFLTVHPLVVMYLVNGGRNDTLVGVAILASVVLASRSRPVAAGIVGALGALVKVTGVVGIVAVFVALFVRGDRRAAYRMLTAAGSVFVAGYLVAGTTALFAPLQTAGALSSSGSAWTTLSRLGLTKPNSHVALAVLALLVVVVLVRHSRSGPATIASASTGMLSLAAAYTLPGYAAWGLPVAALDHRSRVSRIVAASGVVLVVTYEILRHPFTGAVGSVLHGFAAVGGPVVLLLLIVLLVRTSSPSTPEDRTLITAEHPTMPLGGVVPVLEGA